MAGTLEFGKQRLKTKLQTIDDVIEMYNIRVNEFVGVKEKICQNYQKEVLEKINMEFNQLYSIIGKRHKKIIDDVNGNFATVVTRETTIPLNEKFQKTISDLLSQKSKVQSIINEQSSTNFFQESSKLGLEIEKNLDNMINLQIEQFDGPISSTELPKFSFSLANIMEIAKNISLSEKNAVTTKQESVFESEPVLLCPSQFQTESSEIVEKALSDIFPSNLEPEYTSLCKNDSNSVDLGEFHLEKLSLPSQAEQQNTEVSELNKVDVHIKEVGEIVGDNSQSLPSIKSTENKKQVPFIKLSPLQKYKFIATMIQSPSNMHLQIISKEFNQIIPLFTAYHKELDSSSDNCQLIQDEDISFGEIYFSKFELDDCWYRGFILEKFENNGQKNVKVYFIDYGNTDVVSCENLRVLPEQFSVFPQQAFKACLANIKPNSLDNSIPTNNLQNVKHQWDPRVTEWVDNILDAHRSVDGYIFSCGNFNDIELDLILSSQIIKEIASQGKIMLTESQLTLLQKDHVSLRDLLIIGEMGFEAGESNYGNYIETLSFSSNSSHSLGHLPEKNVEEQPSNATPEFCEILGMIQDENSEMYTFADIYQEDGLFSCMLTEIDSLDLFYVNVVHLKAKIIDEIAVDINQYIIETNPPYTPLEVGQCCLAVHIEDNKWYRGIVIDFDANKEKYHVFFVDFGNKAWNTADHIRPIEKVFLRYPAQAIPCRLAGVKPKDALEWPAESIQSFTKLFTFCKLVTAFMVGQEIHERVHQGKVLLKENVISVRLHDYNSSQESLNTYLIQQGFADPIETTCDPDLSPLSLSFSNSPDDLSNWNPMQNDYHSNRNHYDYECNDDHADFGYKGHKRNEICRYYNTKGGCNRGDACLFLHQFSRRNRPNIVPTSYMDTVLELPPVGSYIYCVISAVQSPANFYVRCPYGNIDFTSDLRKKDNFPKLLKEKYPLEESEFYIMNEEMQEFYNKQKHPSSIGHFLSSGEIVVARSSTQVWYRGRIVDPDDVRVLFIDYGFVEIVDASNIRKIEKRFLFVPYQGILCSLSKVKLNPEKLEAANQRFEDLVSRRNILARVDARDSIGSLTLYILMNENEPQDGEISSRCVNTILDDEGLVEYSKIPDSIQNAKEIKIFPE